MSVLEQITSSVRATLEEKRWDFEYRRTLNTKFASAVSRRCLPFPHRSRENTIIAEVKMNSPTKGRLARESDTPASIASQYLRGGAQALSVLTEPIYFEGDLSHLESVRAIAKTTPIMRKDFILDKLQIQEARAYGADGVLLITPLVGHSLKDFLEYAKSVGMWALVETSSEEEIDSAVECGAEIVGVNNRDLVTSNFDLGRSVELCRFIPDDRKFVVESGINYPEDVRYLRENCRRKPDAYLAGTALMTAQDREKKVKDLLEA